MLRDKRIRTAAGVALLELLLIAGFIIVMGKDSRLPVGIVLVAATWLQLGALFFPSGRHSEFGEAQRFFMRGDYEEAARQLESVIANGGTSNNVEARTLLANTYRQIGRLDDSEKLLREVLQSDPEASFPLYGLGRTLLAQGQFAEAAACMRRSLANHGRNAIRADLALADYLNDSPETARDEAHRAARILQLEPYRILMVNHILHRLNGDQHAPTIIERTAEGGLPYWRAESQRFARTPYGERLQEEIAAIEKLLKEQEK